MIFLNSSEICFILLIMYFVYLLKLSLHLENYAFKCQMYNVHNKYYMFEICIVFLIKYQTNETFFISLFKEILSSLFPKIFSLKAFLTSFDSLINICIHITNTLYVSKKCIFKTQPLKFIYCMNFLSSF